MALHKRLKVAIYLGGIAGAFDRIESLLLNIKFENNGIRDKALAFMKSYFEPRKAVVVVGGVKSKPIVLSDQVFQGTVLGPPAWNAMFADITPVIAASSFEDAKYADDLTAYKKFPDFYSTEDIIEEIKECQTQCHKWGDTFRIQFEPTKEHYAILHKRDPHGQTFKLLGILYDTRLFMNEAVGAIVKSVGWKLITLFRVRSQYSITQYLNLYKTQIWSSVEWATPAILHATRTLLDNVDRIQRKFLRFVNVPWDEAFINFKVAPLGLRRKIAMIGLLHRCATGEAPPHLCKLFPLDGRRNATTASHTTRLTTRYHQLRLVDRLDGTQSMMIDRSIFGLVKFYNVMPRHIINIKKPRHLQGYLQSEAMKRCKNGMDIDEINSLTWI